MTISGGASHVAEGGLSLLEALGESDKQKMGAALNRLLANNFLVFFF